MVHMCSASRPNLSVMPRSPKVAIAGLFAMVNAVAGVPLFAVIHCNKLTQQYAAAPCARSSPGDVDELSYKRPGSFCCRAGLVAHSDRSVRDRPHGNHRLL